MLVRETSLFITTCHSILKEDDVSTVLCGRSRFSWSCILHALQEVLLFFWEGERSMSVKEKMSVSHATWSMSLKVYLWYLDCNHAWSHESVQFGRKTFKDITKCSQEWCCSFTRQPILFESVLHKCLSRTRYGTHCCWRCYYCSLAFVLSWCFSLEWKLLFDSSKE